MTDQRAVYVHGYGYGYGYGSLIFRRYGFEYIMKNIKESIMKNKFETQEYSTEISVPLTEERLASSMKHTLSTTLDKIFSETYRTYIRRYTKKDARENKMKVDAHVYTTEAKDLDIGTCENMWIIKYGNEPIPITDLTLQDELTWEIGNRLFWADKLIHDKDSDTYACK